MNPRQRRWLIPGLLIALLVVVVIASVSGRAGAAEPEPAVRLSDPRITESSGLAVSRSDPDLAYTVNDSGNASEVYAVDLTSGRVVGVTTVRATFVDTEALALDDGRLWIADTGDNRGSRSDATIYVIDEPRRRTATVDPDRYPLSLPGGPVDIEALLVDPDDSRVHLITKELTDGRVLGPPAGGWRKDRANALTVEADGLPPLVTDAAYSPDGSRVAVLTYLALWTVDPSTWKVQGSQSLPSLAQAETVAFTSNRRVLVGSEGEDSPLWSLDLAPHASTAQTMGTVATGPTPTSPAPTAAASADSAGGGAQLWWWGIAGGVAAVVAVAVGVRRRR